MTSVSEDRQQSFSPGLAIKQACRLATTAALVYPFQGLLVVDGVQSVAGDRVLVKNQVDTTQNGIWVVATGAWNRPPDYDGSRDVATGTVVFITEGTQQFSAWTMTTVASPIIPGTTAMAFSAVAFGNFGIAPVTGRVIFGGPGSTLAQDANLFWDNATKRLGIGNAAPTVALDVTGTIKASTSVVAPLVGTDTAVNLTIKTNAASRWVFRTDSDLVPAGDLGSSLGNPSFRVFQIVTPIVDSGTAGSLFLKNNNGTTCVEIGNSVTNNLLMAGSAAAFIFRAQGGDANVGLYFDAKANEGHHFRADGGSTTQFEVLRTASANRNITVTGANGGNPVIDVTGGALKLSGGTADIQWGKANVALGGGAAPTVGTIGGTGPAAAAQRNWLRFLESDGTPSFIPVWR